MNKLNYYFSVSDSVSEIHSAIVSLQDISECDSVILSLTKILEQKFLDIEETNGVKQINNLVYYNNGLIKNKSNGKGVIASPWSITVPIKVKKQKVKKHRFLYFKDRNELWAMQLKLYNGSRIVPDKNIQLAPLIKKLAAYDLLPEEAKSVIEFTPHHIKSMYYSLSNFFNASGKTYFHYLNQEHCKDIVSIYNIADPDTSKDARCNTWHYDRKFHNTINRYVNSMTDLGVVRFDFNRKNIDEVLEQLNIDEVLEQLNIKRRSKRRGDNFSDEENTQIKELENRYFKLLTAELKELYTTLYNIPDESFHNLLIKLKIIEDGYIPGGEENEEIELDDSLCSGT